MKDNFAAGDIVVVDWRDAVANEANKLRPAIVVGNSELFGLGTVLLVPIASESAPKVRNAFGSVTDR